MLLARPLNIQSKKALMAYINDTPSELPFVEECWEIAVEETKVRNEKVVEFNRDSPVKRHRVATSRVYFELLKQPRFNKMAKELDLKRKGLLSEDNQDEENGKLKALNFEDYIDDLDSEQGQFILKLLETYFVELYDEDSIKFIISRINSYYGEYELNSASDEYLVITAISDELILRKLNRQRINSGIDSKEMKTIRDSYMSSLDGLKALKKFNQDNKNKENLFSLWVEKLVREGDVDNIKKTYTKDQIDFVLDNNINAIRRSFGG